MTLIKVLIVEDEPLAQSELKRLLKASGHDIQVLDCIDSVEDAVEWINENKAPDLMFFDIQLSDGLSFEILKQVSISSPIIFTTAFDEYAIRAFKVNSIDYLLKPVKQQELNAALAKYVNMRSSASSSPEDKLQLSQIEKLFELSKPRYKTRFITRIGDIIKHIDIEEVAYFKAEDNEVLLITNQGKQFFINHTLDQLGDLVDPTNFFRINRTYLVYLKAIGKISKYFNSRLILELKPTTEEPVLISRVKVPQFLNWMDK
jgi:DNA-binding LytR/AlgR family response regulator